MKVVTVKLAGAKGHGRGTGLRGFLEVGWASCIEQKDRQEGL